MFRRQRAREQFEAVALPLLPAVYRLALHLAGPERADDLVQETYLKAWAHFDRFDRTRDCRAWLFRILHNTWISNWRRRRPEVQGLEPDDIPAFFSSPWWSGSVTTEFSAEMEWALAQLPQSFRWAILLADVEELPYKDIATTMACPIGTVMSRVCRGRRMLARLLEARRRPTAMRTGTRVKGSR